MSLALVFVSACMDASHMAQGDTGSAAVLATDDDGDAAGEGAATIPGSGLQGEHDEARAMSEAFQAIDVACRLAPSPALCCLAGETLVEGSAANDTISTGSAPQCVFGRGGTDVVHTGSAGDTVVVEDGDDQVQAGSGDDRVLGGPGDDVLDAGSGDDVVFGGPGNDTLLGGSGHDALDGGAGDDTLDGGSGNDVLVGGPGLIEGGSGDDLIVVRSPCELVAGESVDGGSGSDTVQSPLDRAAMEALGVSFGSIEHFELTELLPSECDACTGDLDCPGPNATCVPAPALGIDTCRCAAGFVGLDCSTCDAGLEGPFCGAPGAWQSDPDTGTRFRTATSAEREQNGWAVGTVIVEQSLTAAVVEGATPLVVPGASGVDPVSMSLTRRTAPYRTAQLGWAETPSQELGDLRFLLLQGRNAQGLPTAGIVALDATTYSGRTAQLPSSPRYDLSPLRPDDVLLGEGSTNPIMVLQPGELAPVDFDSSDPNNFFTEPAAGTITIGLTADLGMTAEYPTSWPTRLVESLEETQSVFNQLHVNTDPVMPPVLFDPVWLIGNRGLPPNVCTVDFSEAFDNDKVVQVGQDKVPIFDTEDDPAPDFCVKTDLEEFPNGLLYPYADCGFPGFSTCMRDRAQNDFQHAEARFGYGRPQLIQVFHYGRPGSPFTGGDEQRGAMLSRAGSASECGVANLPLPNYWMTPVVTEPPFPTVPPPTDNGTWPGSATCVRCAPVATALNLRGLSAVAHFECSHQLVPAHELAHNFNAEHALGSKTLTGTGLPSEWIAALDANFCPSGSRSSIGAGGEDEENLCRIPILTSSQEARVAHCIKSPNCL